MKSIRATLSSYVVLCGIWVILAVANLITSIRNPGKNWGYAAIICSAVALIWVCWLRGFMIEVSDGWLKYRDGLFRTSKIAINEIKGIKHQWIEIDYFLRKIMVPRLVITASDGKPSLIINSKPFRRRDLNELIREIGG